MAAESAGSGNEPEYGQMREDTQDLQGGVTLGIGQDDNPFAGDHWTSESGSGERREGIRTPEQQAADLLRDAEFGDAVEPDYDFASAEGGNGSPDYEGMVAPAGSGQERLHLEAVPGEDAAARLGVDSSFQKIGF